MNKIIDQWFYSIAKNAHSATFTFKRIRLPHGVKIMIVGYVQWFGETTKTTKGIRYKINKE